MEMLLIVCKVQNVFMYQKSCVRDEFGTYSEQVIMQSSLEKKEANSRNNIIFIYHFRWDW